MKVYVRTYELFYGRNKTFAEDFELVVEEKFINTHSIYSKTILMTWTKIFYAKKCLMKSEDVGKFILSVADELMYKDEGSTIIFMLVFWKVSSKLKEKSPEIYQQCLNYVKQIDLKIVEVDNFTFWTSNFKFGFVSNLERMHRENHHKIPIDESSFNHAKAIFRYIFDSPDTKVAICLDESIGDRLLILHLEYLSELKYYSVGVFHLMQLLNAVAKLYEINFVTNKIIMKIMKALEIDCNTEAHRHFCTKIYCTVIVKNDSDPSLNDFKEYIQQVTSFAVRYVFLGL